MTEVTIVVVQKKLRSMHTQQVQAMEAEAVWNQVALIIVLTL